MNARIIRNGSRGLGYKTAIAFSLMSILPLLACVYIITAYILPKIDDIVTVSLILLFAATVSILGFFLIRRLMSSISMLSGETKLILKGDYDRKISTITDDEVGALGDSINFMTQKMRKNLDELKEYNQRVKEINTEIQKKVLALSSLLQMSDIVSMGSVKLDSLLSLAVEKSAAVFENGYGVLYLASYGEGDFIAKTAYNIGREELENVVIRRDGTGLLNKVLEERSTLVIDKGIKLTKEFEVFIEANKIKNMLAVPLYLHNKILGLLIVGTRVEDMRFKNDEIDLVKIFARQMTIAIETDSLRKKTEELLIKDELTDLYNKNYITARLEDEIKRAIFYQRPCSLVILDIDNFAAFRDLRGEFAVEEAIRKVSKLIKDSLIPTGKAARIGVDEFALLLPEKNKKEALAIADEIRMRIELLHLSGANRSNMTVSGGVSENPIDGTTCDELYKKASDNVRQAKALGKNRVFV